MTGLGAAAFDEQTVAHVVELLPREGFKREFVALLRSRRGESRSATSTTRSRPGFAGLVLAAPYDE